MPLWGKTDNAANSVSWGPATVNKTANTANKTALYGNTTPNAFVTGQTVGIFGMDTTEVGVANGSVVSFEITNAGSGYFANAAVTLSGNATANATANSTGRISAVNIVTAGSGYAAAPTVSIAAPAAQAFNANTAVAANGFIAIASNKFQVNDYVTYTVAAGNTAVVGLTSGSRYYVKTANATGVYVSTTVGGTSITLTPSATSETGHTLTGQTAVAAAVSSGLSKKGLHAGWVKRTVGSGGRAGRVTYETLVAMGSITGDGSDDSIAKDS